MSPTRIVMCVFLMTTISGCANNHSTPTPPSAEMLGQVCELSKVAPKNSDESIVMENQNTECATKRKMTIYDWQDWYRDNFQ